MQKQIQFKVKGMQRDLSASAFNPEYAYENKNVRIMPTDENTLFSIINERGNKSTYIRGVGSNLVGTPIGQSLINNELVVFTAGDKSLLDVDNISAKDEDINDITSEESTIDLDFKFEDRIYKLWFNGGDLNGRRLFKGQLGFDSTHPIEAISFYENSDIRKVYWTDGLNQPRVINVAAATEVINKWNDNSFDFTKKLQLQEEVTIERDIVANGTFSPGIIQYVFTYFNKYGQESNIFYSSPLYYISYNNRGASPEDKVGNSFTITIDNIDKSFDYIRIYSILRTSIDSVPTVKRVVDLATPTGVSTYSVTEWTKYSSEDKIEVYSIPQKKYIPLSSIETNSSGSNVKTWNLSGSSYSIIKFADNDYVPLLGKNLYVYIHRSNVTLHYTDRSKMTVYSYTRSKVSYTDNGTSGDAVDPTELLYVGGEEVIFGTMAQKDNTLFLGDITLKRKTIDSTIRDFFKEKDITFTVSYYNGRTLTLPNPVGYYPYSNQLKLNSHRIKTFKYLETYRFGVQFQHTSGKWSEPIWVNDVRNTQHVQGSYIRGGSIYLPTATYDLSDQTIINRLVSQGYVRVRPVVVYPSLTDRECICQGVLCPTVYNVSDRYGNSPYVQSSWFVRANAPFDIEKAFKYNQSTSGAWGGDWSDRDRGLYNYTINSRAGVMSNNRTTVTIDGGKDVNMDMINKGAWAEFRHNHPIPSNSDRRAEIQCIWNPPEKPYVDIKDSDPDIAGWVSENSENFYIDQSIVTLHSPDIEFDDNIRSIDTSGLKLRIVGYVPLTAFVGDIDIQTSTPANNYHGSSEMAPGFYKEPIGAENISRFGFKGLMSGAFWFDEVSDYREEADNPHRLASGFVVYPFHRNGSLNNKMWAVNGYRPAMLDKKKISNMRFSFNSYYFNSDEIWNAYSDSDNSGTLTGISGISIFDSDEVSLVRLPAPKNSGLPDINYYGNVDKVITISRIGNKRLGYPIMVSGLQNSDLNPHLLFTGNYYQVDGSVTQQVTGVDPVRMKYKSTPHAVIALNYSTGGAIRVLPTMKDGDVSYTGTTETWNINSVEEVLDPEQKLFWDESKRVGAISQDSLNRPIETSDNGSQYGYGPEYGWLWLGEIYNDSVSNRFGGKTEEAFENNQWLPCGEPVSLINGNGIPKSLISIAWIEGDTYYQRYDHLKTYPFTLEDQNAITDIVSFMCETRVNIDGRYDRNRGQTNNFAITPTNFNLLNQVYSQQNNFFNYRTINPNKLNLDNFHNSITWTKTKTAGELIDTWTNITLASTLDLDGDKGDVRAIRRFNNNLIAFQDRGISQILYNENMQVASTEGVPIEIANSGKVSGKRYLTDKIGCTNKWSICETSNGVYFIDDITKGIFLFNGKLDNLSDRLGFHSWINSRSTAINIWNPIDFNGFVTYYDKVNGDVLFISKSECLAFSEPLGQFASFYSYEGMPYFINLEDRGIALNTDSASPYYKVWMHNEGDYNMFFGKYHPFYTTVIANPNMAVDKVFNNLEFRADSWKGKTLLNTTFDTLTTWNEYQTGTSTLNNILGRPSELKKKFRIWRANIPRDKANGRDRMRNPWLYIKLSMEKRNTNKTILHDMIVHYFE